MIKCFEVFDFKIKRGVIEVQPKHPEQREGEVFYCNVHDRKQFSEMDFETKRMGKIAYSLSEREIKPLTTGRGPFPVFVQKSELDQKHQEAMWKLRNPVK